MNILEQLRKEKGLSQPEVAKRANINSGYYSQLENKVKTNPSAKTIRSLKNVLGDRVVEFFLQ